MTAPVEGFVFGLASSLHCAAMCGPLALFAAQRASAVAAYHGSRFASYLAVGAILGAVGGAAGIGVFEGGAPWIAVTLGVALFASALGLDRFLGSIPGVSRLVQHAVGRARSWSVPARSAVLGGITPLLPCGVLWALFGAALLAGDGRTGALTTAGFALGSAPLLVLGQLHASLIHRRLGPRGGRIMARGAMAIAAAVLLWRGITGLEGGCCSA